MRKSPAQVPGSCGRRARYAVVVGLGLALCLAAGCGQDSPPPRPAPAPVQVPPPVAPTPAPPTPIAVPGPQPAGGPKRPPAADGEPYEYGWVGASFDPVSPERASQLGLPHNHGSLVFSVEADGPAAKCDLRKDDFVVALDGQDAPHPRVLIERIRSLAPGARARLDLLRGKDKVSVEVTTGGRPVKSLVLALAQRGAEWLTHEQRPEGWWPHASEEFVGKEGQVSIAFTALCFAALARLPAEARADPAVAQSLEHARTYILAHIQPDGGLQDPRETGAIILRNFASSLAIVGLCALDREQAKEPVGKLAAFLTKRQLADDNGFPPHEWQHGSWNYYEENRTYTLRSDLVVLSYVLEALDTAGLPKDDAVWARARRFLKLSQNYREEPGKRLSYDDGGFAFNPRSSKAGEVEASPTNIRFTSYGSMTADGLRSLRYAGCPADDPRVEAALDWLRKNFAVDRNPGFPAKAPVDYAHGLHYYYLRSLAEALSVQGQKKLTGPDGRGRYWLREMTDVLRVLQGPDGRWQNEINIMSEDDPIVATSFSLLALGRIHQLLP